MEKPSFSRLEEEVPPKFERGLRGEDQPLKGVNIKLSFPGANPHPRIEPFNRLETVISYFIGNDPEKWRADVPVWGGVRYVELFPGIDLEITGEGVLLVQRLVAHPGADLSAVRLRVEGADVVELAGGEALRLTTAVGEFTLPLLRVEGGGGWRGPSAVVQGAAAQTFEVTAPFSSVKLNLQSAIQNQQSKTSNPKPAIQNQQSKTSNPKPAIQ